MIYTGKQLIGKSKKKEATTKLAFTFSGTILTEERITRSVMVVTEGDGVLEV